MSERLNGATVDMKLPAAGFPTGKPLPEGFHANGITFDSVIGRGGTATVFKGRHSEDPQARPVAVKVSEGRSVTGVSLQNEISAGRVLSGKSDHLVDMHDHGVGDISKSEPREFIEMEYVPGGSVRELLRTEGALSAERTLALIDQTASGLLVVHREGLVHRDIKPANLLIGENGVQVADFGIATPNTHNTVSVAVDKLFDVEATGLAVGTPAYMAPEQLEGQADPRTDVQGLALTAYEMLLGKKFRHETSTDRHQIQILLDPEQYDDQVEASVHELEEIGYREFVTPMRAAASRTLDARHPDPRAFVVDLQDRMAEVAEDRKLVARTVFIPGRNINSDTIKVAA